MEEKRKEPRVNDVHRLVPSQEIQKYQKAGEEDRQTWREDGFNNGPLV